MSASTKDYEVVNGTLRHNGVKYKEGDTVALTDKEAKTLKDAGVVDAIGTVAKTAAASKTTTDKAGAK